MSPAISMPLTLRFCICCGLPSLGFTVSVSLSPLRADCAVYYAEIRDILYMNMDFRMASSCATIDRTQKMAEITPMMAARKRSGFPKLFWLLAALPHLLGAQTTLTLSTSPNPSRFGALVDRKSTRLNSSHLVISY